ncbi:outer membrane fimbrial usher porin [Yersinia aldovae]|uniref:Outer membrane fimbrial usher porin n=1 Tax=Yersinia aldovae TaxID=29483 RepID=A0A0T9UWC3_YERAL|nr:fimbria/pilus outer membrane usher protein [Yersinia aldovae]CNL77902.1 outer membrane fimbrial usher porin [Yersinia aldovae]
MKNYNSYRWLFYLPLFSFEVIGVEFNTEFLKIGDQGQVDLSQFSSGEKLAPGNYLVDIIVNNNYVTQQQVNFLENASNSKSQPCLPKTLVETFGLKSDYVLTLPEQSCLTPDKLPGITINYHKSNGQLKITVPQSLLEYYDKNYTPPEQWDNGVAGLMLDYRFIGNTRQDKHAERINSLSSFGTAGANLGGWRLRGDYQFSNYSDNNGNQSLGFNNIHMFRPLPSIKSLLTMGETFLSSDIFDTVSFRGLKLASDERMLPPSLRGYAPRITGIAKTNARITVSQLGRTIYMTTVPPGPFSIQDMSSAVQGELQVTIQEEDGSSEQFSVNTSSVPFLTRQGQFRYNTSVGKPTNVDSHAQKPVFGMGELSYGITNTWSAYGGSILAEDYYSLAFGIGKDLYQFGAMSFDVTQAHATIEDKQLVGHSYRLNYAKRFDSLDADIHFFGYRFSDKKFVSLNEFTNTVNSVIQRDNKESYSIVTAKQFGEYSTYLSYTNDTYWNAESAKRFGISLSTRIDVAQFKNISLDISLSYNKDHERDDVISYLGISIPLEGQTRVSYNQQTGDGRFNPTVSLRKNHGKNDYYQLTAGSTHNDPMVSGYYQHKTDAYKLGVSGSNVSQSYNSVTVNFSGSMVTTPKGSALHSSGSGGNTRLLVDTHGVSDVTFNNGKNHTNKYGYAVIDGASAYENFEARVDVNNLPKNAESNAPIRSVVLTEGAIGYVPFEMNKGSKILVLLKGVDGNPLPFGAEVTNEQTGKSNAIVGEQGLTYLIGVNPDSQLVVRWADQSCLIVLPPALSENTFSPQSVICRKAT